MILPLPEVLWGRGLGKWLLSLRVVSRATGARPSGSQVLRRLLAGMLEIGMCFGILPLIVIASTPHAQRLGDLWADTLVVPEADDQAAPSVANSSSLN